MHIISFHHLQGLMEAALHASTISMASALRRVLGGLHGAKSAPGVDALLLRLYQPILFRALSAANPAVRRNALGLLVDAFPLQVENDVCSTNPLTHTLLTVRHLYWMQAFQCDALLPCSLLLC